MISSPEKHGVKAMQVNRQRIKERIQEKHQKQQQQVRNSRLSGLREIDDGDETSDGTWRESITEAVDMGSSNVICSSTLAPEPALSCNLARSLMVPAVQDWSDIGHEFGVNIRDADVMEYLLALEEEIRHERVFQFYDQANGNEWEEYFCSLTG
ncbi:hypothetical protein JKF63_01486 [Porcisia hertigi]|uniref:Uncharacterized protein n=1 Tax=Porcisia hertigi TaxID=2761500 RepID=A0A836KZH3_9TRYP|nr:hypothetical protein JKF63_01486 [Porcisia hertigi]